MFCRTFNLTNNTKPFSTSVNLKNFCCCCIYSSYRLLMGSFDLLSDFDSL